MSNDGVQVCIRVRPLNHRETDEGQKKCVAFDEQTKQVVLAAVNKDTLLSLKSGAKGFAFDRRYGEQHPSEVIFQDVVYPLVESCFKGYNATILAYGQTGSGKTHTMAGGVGILGVPEEGIAPCVIRQMFANRDALQSSPQSSVTVSISACALELYNEELRDLALDATKAAQQHQHLHSPRPITLHERPVGRDGRIVPEVSGVSEMVFLCADDLLEFFHACMAKRKTSSTRLNDTSSRSHAIFTITLHVTTVESITDVHGNERSFHSESQSKLHLVDLAGSERVKRSGVSGKEFKEATHINSGLLALGNVISALAAESEGKRSHIPYRDSKLTRLLQDSLGGNSLTVLIACVSPAEGDFDETQNTLSYANRACKIRNKPLPNKYVMLDEGLPMVPTTGLGLAQLTALLENAEAAREVRERREREAKEKNDRRRAALKELRKSGALTPGYYRLRSQRYDELRRLAVRVGYVDIGYELQDDALFSFNDRPLSGSGNGRRMSNDHGDSPHYTRTTAAFDHQKSGSGGRPHSASGTPEVYTSTGRVHRPRTASQVLRHRSAPGGAGGILAAFGTVGQDGSGGASAGGGLGEGQTFADWVASADTPRGGSLSGSRRSSRRPSFDVQQALRDASAGGVDISHVNDVLESLVIDRDALDDDDEEEDAADDVDDEERWEQQQQQQQRGGGSSGAGSGYSDDLRHDTSRGGRSRAAAARGKHGSGSGAAAADSSSRGKPRLLARFKVSSSVSIAVFKAVSKDDFAEVMKLLPRGTTLPGSDKMVYLMARLEVGSRGQPMKDTLEKASAPGAPPLSELVGPAVGCLMATFGTSMISSCIFRFDDPPELADYPPQSRIELWGLQIPHTSSWATTATDDTTAAAGDTSNDAAAAAAASAGGSSSTSVSWSSLDRLHISSGLLYGLCRYASGKGVSAGLCVPRPQLLRRWLSAGITMTPLSSPGQLIYPSSAHDYAYYQGSTVAYFMVDQVSTSLGGLLALPEC